MKNSKKNNEKSSDMDNEVNSEAKKSDTKKKEPQNNKIQKEIDELSLKTIEIQKQNDELVGKVAEYEDIIKRQQAEFDNYRKRVNEERQGFTKYGSEKVLKDFLTIYENFVKAVAVETDDDKLKSFIDGFKLIKEQLDKMLSNHGVSESTQLGDPFNPDIHQAIQVDDQGGESEKVSEVYQQGFFLHDRLLREAVVKIEKID